MSLQDSKIGFISLGCPKALVDSERILTQLRSEGYQIVPTYNKADLVIVNTCGFIDSAVEESMDAIQEAMTENGKVIVTGCLGVKKDLLQQRFPSLLSISGPQDYESVMKAVHQQLPQKHDPFTSLVPPQGIKLTPKHYAYLKISEGCNHRCSFCIIPSMRGNLVSRSVADIMREAEQLAKSGVRELLVISQDTSAYGVDIKYAESLWKDKSIRAHITDLANALSELGIWIRFHYVYPYPHVSSLIELMAEGKILPYIDVPFQHASPRVLKAMKRPANSEKTLETVLQWRKICPELTIRSTFIVGFPGETQDDFEELLDFIDEAELDRVGCFKYSPVEGAKANELANPVPEEVKEERWQEFMALQAEISAERLHNKIGTQQIVLIDEVTAEGAIARSTADAPEIDGVVVIENGQNLKVGEFATVTIVDANEYDLFAEFSTGAES